ncbi:MAG TPA: substrate-binding domain-containing protein [Candidatus Sulfotelmatobacter sp.]|jgi:ribose transport system substrate-binding protein
MHQIKVLISLVTNDNDFQLEQAASARAAAAECGAAVEIIYAANDAVAQTQQILSYIQEPSRRPDAILVEPVGTGMAQVAQAAISAGIGWGIVNSDVDYITRLRGRALVPVFVVVADHEEIGRIQGRQIGALLGEKGCVLYLEGPSVRDVAKLRSSGARATKPHGVDIKTLRGDWTQESAYQSVRSWLALATSRQLNVGLIASQNDAMAMGARRAFLELRDPRERDAWLRLPLTGCDGVSKAGQAWVREGLLAATVICPPLMGPALTIMANAIRSGAQPDERTVIPATSYPAIEELQTKALARAASNSK